jgi:hypothetical protein
MVNRVGYGKPPRQTRFKKGRSGNPKGRPKGSPNLSKVLKKALNETVVVHQDGQRKRITKLQAAATQLANKAASGDARAIEQTLKRVGDMDDEHEAQPDLNEGFDENDEKVIELVIQRLRRAILSEPDNQSNPEDKNDRDDTK